MRYLNDRLDRDARCMLTKYGTDDPECRARGGVIPAGEQHCRWDGVQNEDGTSARVCVHCVRKSDWDHFKNKKLPTKIRIEYSDGTAQELTGEAAIDWSETVNAQGVFAAVHGAECKPLPWKESK